MCNQFLNVKCITLKENDVQNYQKRKLFLSVSILTNILIKMW